MSRHDEYIRLRHMCDHAAEAIAKTQGKKRDDLNTDRLLELALIRLMEIIGEAAGRISPMFTPRARNCRISLGRKSSPCATG